ncbi:MAG: substrate-binding domain-containing protein, partial [Gemmatimonadales bacterium]
MTGTSRRRTASVAVLGALVAAVLLGACSSSSNNASTTTTSGSGSGSASLASLQKWPSSPVALQETGSSLVYPLFNLWQKQIQTEWPNVSITTAATGSGTGISSAADGTVNIGASDAYLSPAQVAQTPGLLNIPLAISGQQINYNVPGVTGHLKLDASTIAQIYTGKITNWNDPKIAALNPG